MTVTSSRLCHKENRTAMCQRRRRAVDEKNDKDRSRQCWDKDGNKRKFRNVLPREREREK